MTTPAFRSLAEPLDASDEELANLNRTMRVPRLEAAAQRAATSRCDVKAVNMLLPRYLAREIKRRAFEGETSEKYVVMKALADAGFAIDPADLVLDGRAIR